MKIKMSRWHLILKNKYFLLLVIVCEYKTTDVFRFLSTSIKESIWNLVFSLGLRMIMKSLLVGFSLILFLINGITSLHEDEYVLAIEKLLLNKQFLKEYEKWSSKLFSDPDYLYGEKPAAFPCQISSKPVPNEDLTVHNLRPNDIQCVAAIGDSLTAGLGAQAKTPIGLVTEYRGKIFLF